MSFLANSYFENIFYVNPLTKNQKDFLEKTDHRGLSNPTETRKNITEQLSKSFRIIHHIMDNPQHLKKDDIYDILNAKTLTVFLKRLVSDISKSDMFDDTPMWDSKIFAYDFRTSEIARLMVSIGLDYLGNSTELKTNENFHEIHTRINEYFKHFSLNKMSNEITKPEYKENFKKGEFDKIVKKKQDLERKISDNYDKIGLLEDVFKIFNSGKMRKEIESDVQNLVINLKLCELTIERLQKNKNLKKKIASIKKQIKELNEELKNKEEIIFELEDIGDKEGQLHNITQTLMEPVGKYFSHYNPLIIPEYESIQKQIGEKNIIIKTDEVIQF